MKIDKRPLSKTHYDGGNVRSACGQVKVSIENSYALTTEPELVTCDKCRAVKSKTERKGNEHNIRRKDH